MFRKTILLVVSLLLALGLAACSEEDQAPTAIVGGELNFSEEISQRPPEKRMVSQLNVGDIHNIILRDIHQLYSFPYDKNTPIEDLIRTTKDALIFNGVFDQEIWDEVLTALQSPLWDNSDNLNDGDREWLTGMLNCWDRGQSYEEKRTLANDFCQIHGIPTQDSPLGYTYEIYFKTSEYWEEVDPEKGWLQVGRDDIIGASVGYSIGRWCGRPIIGTIIGAAGGSALRMAIDQWGKKAVFDPGELHNTICAEILLETPLESHPSIQDIKMIALKIGQSYDPDCQDYFENGMSGLKNNTHNPTKLNLTDWQWWNGLVETTQATTNYAEFRAKYFDYCLNNGLPTLNSELYGALDVYLSSIDFWSEVLPEKGFWSKVRATAFFDATGFLHGARVGSVVGRPLVGGAIVGAAYSIIEIFEL